MKKFFILLCLIACGLTASAETFNFLNIVQTDTQKSYKIDSVRKLTFEGTDLVVTQASGDTYTCELATLQSLTFTNTATAMTSARSHRQSLVLSAGQLVTSGSGTLRLFDAKGQLVRMQSVSGGRTEMNLNGLPHGLYIARLGQQTLKLVH